MTTLYTNTFILLSLLSASAGAAPLIAFTSSTTGTGDLHSWTGAGPNTGAAAGDAVCKSLATIANLPNPNLFVAWISDSATDAYCRIHGLTGKKANNCGLPALPTGAGPWVRTDGFPFMATVDQALDSGLVYSSLNRDELGALLITPVGSLTGTTNTGVFDLNNVSCSSWTAASSASPIVGFSNATLGGWTAAGSGVCSFNQHLICMQKGSGSALPNDSQRGRREAFVSSLSVTGNLGAAPQAGANTGVAAGDAICRSLAAQANLYAPQSFKAFLSNTSTAAIAHFQFDGPWVRRDGLRIADNLAQLATGNLNIPLNQTENGNYLGNYAAWTGSSNTGGIAANRCTDWTSTAGTAAYSSVYFNGPNWGGNNGAGIDCTVPLQLYCLSDIDVIFHDGFQ